MTPEQVDTLFAVYLRSFSLTASNQEPIEYSTSGVRAAQALGVRDGVRIRAKCELLSIPMSRREFMIEIVSMLAGGDETPIPGDT